MSNCMRHCSVQVSAYSLLEVANIAARWPLTVGTALFSIGIAM